MPDEFRTDIFYGEALYFQSRCPQYKSVNMESAALTYCLISKTLKINCDAKTLYERFFLESNKVKNLSTIKYGMMPDHKVCEIAESKYGKNGTVFKRLLQP
ncbi:hypothetical protein GCM10011491_09140 [Brucella endophytica]|uniref:Uncharacterized protein n=2 Tax=Brucella endophytica TaxID=1963359 RepID=A0A916S714_9HYPH|nr:hypothetical protein GCM10011491_09140 [Brucella endophytica]